MGLLGGLFGGGLFGGGFGGGPFLTTPSPAPLPAPLPAPALGTSFLSAPPAVRGVPSGFMPPGTPGTNSMPVAAQPGVNYRPLSPASISRVYGEASHAGDVGLNYQSVLQVAKNRLGTQFPGGASGDINNVFNARNQFSASPNLNVPPSQAAMIQAKWQAIANGQVPDVTGGATNYYAPSGMPGGRPPRWADPSKFTTEIGQQKFYNLGGNTMPTTSPRLAATPDVWPIGAPPNNPYLMSPEARAWVQNHGMPGTAPATPPPQVATGNPNTIPAAYNGQDFPVQPLSQADTTSLGQQQSQGSSMPRAALPPPGPNYTGNYNLPPVPPPPPMPNPMRVNPILPVDTEQLPPIPVRPPEVQTYGLQPGDNPWTVAKQFGVPWLSLLQANNIPISGGRSLPVGYPLNIPRGY